MKINRTMRFVLAAELLLLAPLIAMQFTSEVSWSLGDFIVGSILLAGFGYTFSMILSKSTNLSRTLIGLVLAGLLFLLWTELAVGVFGTTLAGS